jgi:hypothetical protein
LTLILVSYKNAPRTRPGIARQTRPQSRFFCRTQTALAADPTVIADGIRRHSQYQISVLIDGKPKALNVPAGLAAEVREKMELRRRFDAAAAAICDVNLQRFLKQKEDRPA